MTEDKVQSQAEVAEGAEQAGIQEGYEKLTEKILTEPQRGKQPKQEQPGAGEPPQAELKPGEGEQPSTERMFSQAEVSKMESAKDQEIAAERNARTQIAMQAQIAQQQQVEATAQAKDRSDIDQGLITEAEAQQRYQGRVRAWQAQQRTIQMQPRVEAMGRMMAAQDFGGRHGVDPYELLSDQSIQTPQQMEVKAKELAQSKSDTEKKTVSDEIASLNAKIKALEEGEPLFDSGQQGAGALDLEGLSPSEQSKVAYSPREVSRRKKTRKK